MTLGARAYRWRALIAGLLSAMSLAASAGDLGIEGQVFEPIEEDFRLAVMRMVAAYDWEPDLEGLKDSARNYTKNLPSYWLPRAAKTQTKWKDVGVQVTEDIYMPHVEWETGSIFEPEKLLVAQAGTYLNPIAKIPSNLIKRLFIFDATDPDQLALARALMVQDIPNLAFMLVAGDLGPLSEEMHRPIFHPAPTMLEKFHITAVPSLVGFGRGPHQGHMAVTEFAMPVTRDMIQNAWFGLPYSGYDPENISDVPADGADILRPQFLTQEKP